MTANTINALQRATTEYVEEEDRICLSGELATGDTMTLWLTRRILDRLVPHLTGWLVRQTTTFDGAHQELVQEFAQHAAQAQLQSEQQARVAPVQSGWLVEAIDITPGEEALQLVFKGEAATALILSAQPLRQWLGILLQQYQRGDWPATVWPAWMKPETGNAEGRLMH